jgi:hypothetical protein
LEDARVDGKSTRILVGIIFKLRMKVFELVEGRKSLKVDEMEFGEVIWKKKMLLRTSKV